MANFAELVPLPGDEEEKKEFSFADAIPLPEEKAETQQIAEQPFSFADSIKLEPSNDVEDVKKNMQPGFLDRFIQANVHMPPVMGGMLLDDEGKASDMYQAGIDKIAGTILEHEDQLKMGFDKTELFDKFDKWVNKPEWLQGMESAAKSFKDKEATKMVDSLREKFYDGDMSGMLDGLDAIKDKGILKDYYNSNKIEAIKDSVSKDMNKYVLSNYLGEGYEGLKPETSIKSLAQAFALGTNEGSTLGMASQIIRDKKVFDIDPRFQPDTLLESISQSLGSLIPDIPLFMVGGWMGKAASSRIGLSYISKTMFQPNAPLMSAGLKAIESGVQFGFVDGTKQAIREKLIHDNDPEAWNVIEAADRVLKETGKGATVGGAMGVASTIPAGYGLRMTGEVAAITATPALLEGRLPTFNDFAHSVGVIAALKGPNAFKKVTDFMTLRDKTPLVTYSENMINVLQEKSTHPVIKEMQDRGMEPQKIAKELRFMGATEAIKTGKFEGITGAEARAIAINKPLNISKLEGSVNKIQSTLGSVKTNLTKLRKQRAGIKRRKPRETDKKGNLEAINEKISFLERIQSKRKVDLKDTKKELNLQRRLEARRAKLIVDKNLDMQAKAIKSKSVLQRKPGEQTPETAKNFPEIEYENILSDKDLPSAKDNKNYVKGMNDYLFLPKKMFAEDLVVNGLTKPEIMTRIKFAENASAVSGLVMRGRRINNILRSEQMQGVKSKDSRVKRLLTNELNSIKKAIGKRTKKVSEDAVTKTLLDESIRKYDAQEKVWMQDYKVKSEQSLAEAMSGKRVKAGHLEPTMWIMQKLERDTGIPFMSFIYKQGRRGAIDLSNEMQNYNTFIKDTFNDAGIGSSFRPKHIRRRRLIAKFLEHESTSNMGNRAKDITDQHRALANELGMNAKELRAAQVIRSQFFGNMVSGKVQGGLFSDTGMDPSRFLQGYLPRLRDMNKLSPQEYNKMLDTMRGELKGKVHDFFLNERTGNLTKTIDDPMVAMKLYARGVKQTKHLGPWKAQVDAMLESGAITGNAKAFTEKYRDAVLSTPTPGVLKINDFVRGLAQSVDYNFIQNRKASSNVRKGAETLVNYMNSNRFMNDLASVQYNLTLSYSPMSVIKNHTQKMLTGMIHGYDAMGKAWAEYKVNPESKAMVDGAGLTTTPVAYGEAMNPKHITFGKAMKSKKDFWKYTKQSVRPLGSYGRSDLSNRAAAYIASVDRFEAAFKKHGYTKAFFKAVDMDLLDPIIQRDVLHRIQRGNVNVRNGKKVSKTGQSKFDYESGAHVYADYIQLITQFPYEAGGSPMMFRGAAKPVLGVFQTWYNHYGHFMSKMASKIIPGVAGKARREGERITGVKQGFRPARTVAQFSKYLATSMALASAAEETLGLDLSGWFGLGPMPDGIGTTPLLSLMIDTATIAGTGVNVLNRKIFKDEDEFPNYITRNFSEAWRNLARNPLTPMRINRDGKVVMSPPHLRAKQLLEAIEVGEEYRGKYRIYEGVKDFMGTYHPRKKKRKKNYKYKSNKKRKSYKY